MKLSRVLFPVLLLTWVNQWAYSQVDFQTAISEKVLRSIDEEVEKWIKKGNIPGLSLVIEDSSRQIIKTYGYSNAEKGKPVSTHTLFQLGSCSKAFTALAVAKLVKAGLIKTDAFVSDYIPWFHAVYKDSPVKITILQVLHHTSGIPWQTISSIPEGNGTDMLEQTVRNIAGINLRYPPGKKFEYATINYDILALVIQIVTRQPFETYMQEHVLNTLGLHHTTIGKPADSSLLSTGYKIGFFRAREYKAPIYAGNNAAGYIISDAEDIGRWLRFQMGLDSSELNDLASITHERDETVAIHGMSSYAMGWEVSLSGNQEINHDGVNPNYTAYIAFRPHKRIGIAILANSNSNYTPVIGNRVMRLLASEKMGRQFDPGDGNDRVYSLGSIVLGGYFLGALSFFVLMLIDIIKGRRRLAGFTLRTIVRFLLSLCILAPFLFGMYLFPVALAGFTWKSMFVWNPSSFGALVIMILCSTGISYLAYCTGLLFPEDNKVKKVIPRILLMSVLAGIANIVVIILVTSALDTSVRLRYLTFYYILAVSLYLFGRRFVQINLIKLSRTLIYELRVKVIEKIFSTSYQKFEPIDKGRVYTTLNDDVETLGGSADQFVLLVTNAFTVAGAFLYLASIAFWASVLVIGLITAITTIYYFVSRSTNPYFEKARDSQNVFVSLVNGMIGGFKEISLNKNKKVEYQKDIILIADEYREKTSIAGIRFVNAFLSGESLLVLLLGAVVFALPRLFPGIPYYTITGFIIVLLYLIGPVNGILGSVPVIMRLKVAWNRIQQFLKEIPAGTGASVSFCKAGPDLSKTASSPGKEAIDPDKEMLHEPLVLGAPVKNIRAEGLKFTYKDDQGQEAFGVGPIDLEINSGEILFIIGGNGSGKTTLAKLLTGLYEPDEGRMLIDNKTVRGAELSGYFSAVFNPPWLFEKLFDIDGKGKSEEIAKYLKILKLEEKVEIRDNRYSTIQLSGGQRKRLALLQCYLEDSPIYIFDEWAADQDPEYRSYFYRTLLPEMRRMNKIVIAITHDDHYFDVADKVLKMRQGKLQEYTTLSF